MKKFLKYYLFGILLLCSTFVIGAQTPKYIFLFIGDGMGFGQVELSQRFAEKVGTNTGDHSLFFTTFPVATNVCTYSLLILSLALLLLPLLWLPVQRPIMKCWEWILQRPYH